MFCRNTSFLPNKVFWSGHYWCWVGWFLFAGGGPVRWRVLSGAHGQKPVDAESVSVLGCWDIQKCVWTLPDALWGAKSVSVKNLCYRMKYTHARFWTGNFIVFGIFMGAGARPEKLGRLRCDRQQPNYPRSSPSSKESTSWIASFVMRIPWMFVDCHYQTLYPKGRWNWFM